MSKPNPNSHAESHNTIASEDEDVKRKVLERLASGAFDCGLLAAACGNRMGHHHGPRQKDGGRHDKGKGEDVK
ncbi:uncharacterized protein HKW66_Vig0245750 [Vigna angularis]|uniref:Uncharacterized protein n=1 Tax=Phaseolus angularis TaxID=3914 RepID=A0A8T0KCP4_PHAAN|nr:uncharacterized protein HKW66_Vig0245750 [Vigna angularis]